MTPGPPDGPGQPAAWGRPETQIRTGKALCAVPDTEAFYGVADSGRIKQGQGSTSSGDNRTAAISIGPSHSVQHIAGTADNVFCAVGNIVEVKIHRHIVAAPGHPIADKPFAVYAGYAEQLAAA